MDPSQRFADSVWFLIITASTVGYGDYFPVTDAGKVVVLLFISCKFDCKINDINWPNWRETLLKLSPSSFINQVLYSVGISIFATMLPEIIDILGSQPKYAGNYKVNIRNKKSRQ